MRMAPGIIPDASRHGVCRRSWRRRDQEGQTGLLLLGFLAGSMLLAGLWLRSSSRSPPDPIALRQQHLEIHRGLIGSIRQHQVIPGPEQWTQAVEAYLSLASGTAGFVYPQHPHRNHARRYLVVDPGLATSLLPYEQNMSGLQGAQTNLMGPSGRMILVSQTRPGLAIPMADRRPTTAEFEALWAWEYDPITRSPPAGWPQAWRQQGHHLQVTRIHLADEFHKVQLGLGKYAHRRRVPEEILAKVHRWYLHGTHLRVHNRLDVLRLSRVILKDTTLFGELEEHRKATYFLTGNGTVSDKDGIPCATLSREEPTAGALPNYDPKRDAFPGLLLAKGGSGPNETDATKVQQWITDFSPVTLQGEVTLTLFSAMKDFNRNKGGRLVLYLVETNPAGKNQQVLASAVLRRTDWDTRNTGGWIEDRVSFGQLTVEIPFPHRLGVVIVVHPDADDDHWFAYGTTVYPARLEVQ